MKTITALAVVALALPAAALAEDPPSPQERANGARTCKQLRESMGADTFKLTYRNLGACVSKWAHEHQEANDATSSPREAKAEVAEEVQATLNAAKSCKRDRTADRAAFAAKWGSGANAFGKCVSSHAKAEAGQP